jgi:hypothetical protein
MQKASRILVRRTFWLPISLIAAGGLLAFVFWSLPNWRDFTLILSEWSSLWAIPSNRLILVALIIKVLSPLFLMAMIGILIWIWYLVRGISEVTDPVTPIPETLISPSAVNEEGGTPFITIRLLGEMTMLITVPGGDPFVVKMANNLKKLEMLAYIACRQGKPVDRDRLLEQVFGWRLQDEDSTTDKLQIDFDTAKKLLRKDLRRAVDRINKLVGKQILDPDLLIRTSAGLWQLAGNARVEDLATIDACSSVISLARNAGKLTDTLPEEVRRACEQILDVYVGDFLAALIELYPEEFGAWRGKASWARIPLTHYRDIYLDAVWLLAQHSARQSEQSQEWAAKAAGFYEKYAMYACNSKLDLKVFWRQTVGERIGMSERAVRRCVVFYGMLGQTDEVNRVWSAYSDQMRKNSDGKWRPDQETLQDVDAARSNTSAHRFGTVLTQMSSGEKATADHASGGHLEA